jgi:hypothetical protein
VESFNPVNPVNPENLVNPMGFVNPDKTEQALIKQ